MVWPLIGGVANSYAYFVVLFIHSMFVVVESLFAVLFSSALVAMCICSCCYIFLLVAMYIVARHLCLSVVHFDVCKIPRTFLLMPLHLFMPLVRIKSLNG